MIKYRSTKKHTIDALFPMILFLVMTVFALFVIILAANIYKNSSENSYRNHQSRIALSYISEKIHQNTDCQISIERLHTTNALTLKKEHQGSCYITYIYYHDNSLRELFVKEGISFSLSDGKKILELSDFSVKKIDDSLLYFTCTDFYDQTADSYVSIAK